MNNKKAKRIRLEIYGDFSHRVRTYTRDVKHVIRCTGLRRDYQDAKRASRLKVRGVSND